MSKLEVFQNVTKKRTESGFSAKNLGTVLLLLLLLPYIITFLFGNLWPEPEAAGKGMVEQQLMEGRLVVSNKTALGVEEIPLELYVADCLSRVMEEDSPEEALKAQAVLIRTNLLSAANEDIFVEDDGYGEKDIPEKCAMAAAETKGMYLEYEGKPIYGAYCRVSAGKTRTAAEFLYDGDYPYLSGAVCGKDFLSEEYIESVSFGKDEFERIWKQVKEAGEEEVQKARELENGEEKNEKEAEAFTMIRDSAGYVIFFRHDKKWVTGEALRYALHLPSASFSIEQEEGRYLFTVKGVGHGLGMSQFAARQMAEEGQSYTDILFYFFKDVNVTKIE